MSDEPRIEGIAALSPVGATKKNKIAQDFNPPLAQINVNPVSSLYESYAIVASTRARVHSDEAHGTLLYGRERARNKKSDSSFVIPALPGPASAPLCTTASRPAFNPRIFDGQRLHLIQSLCGKQDLAAREVFIAPGYFNTPHKSIESDVATEFLEAMNSPAQAFVEPFILEAPPIEAPPIEARQNSVDSLTAASKTAAAVPAAVVALSASNLVDALEKPLKVIEKAEPVTNAPLEKVWELNDQDVDRRELEEKFWGTIPADAWKAFHHVVSILRVRSVCGGLHNMVEFVLDASMFSSSPLCGLKVQIVATQELIPRLDIVFSGSQAAILLCKAQQAGLYTVLKEGGNSTAAPYRIGSIKLRVEEIAEESTMDSGSLRQ